MRSSARVTESERLEKNYRSEATKEVDVRRFFEVLRRSFSARRGLLRPLIRKARWVFHDSIVAAREYWCVDFGRGSDRAQRADAAGVRQRHHGEPGGALRLAAQRRLYQRRYLEALARAHQARQRDAPLRASRICSCSTRPEYLSPKSLFSWRFISGYARRFPEVSITRRWRSAPRRKERTRSSPR